MSEQIEKSLRIQQVKNLQAKEEKMMHLIAATGNEELMNTFLEWQKLRNEIMMQKVAGHIKKIVSRPITINREKPKKSMKLLKK